MNEEFMNPEIIIRHKKGCIGPSMICGVYVYPNDQDKKTIITNIYEAVDFINEYGLRRC